MGMGLRVSALKWVTLRKLESSEWDNYCREIMMKVVSTKFFLLIFIFSIFSISISCQYLLPGSEMRVFSDGGNYAIETSSVLEQLAIGDNGVFSSINKMDDGEFVISHKTVRWS